MSFPCKKSEEYYSFLSISGQFFQEESLSTLYRNGQIKILEIEGKEGIKLDAYLKLYSQYEKEGEFNLVLYWGEILLATLTFSIVEGNLFIGGLQGLGREYTDPEILKQVTKGFYGLFPKRLLMEIFMPYFRKKDSGWKYKSYLFGSSL